MSDPRQITRIDTEEIKLTSSKSLYYLVTENGIFRSKDGRTWKKCFTGG